MKNPLLKNKVSKTFTFPKIGRYFTFSSLVILLAFITAGYYQGEEASPDFALESGLKLVTVASEPLVIDPVAYTYDARGFLYVVEDRGYPDPAEGGAPASKKGRVARLEDTNGDGRYDRRTEFATGFTYPNGIIPWKGGVFVTCAPDIFYLKDTTGNGKADLRQVVLTGFKDTKTSQLRMSHPTLGFDGWIYVTSGLNGGKVYSPLYPDRPPVTFNATDVRFHPDTYQIEVAGGKSQFGMTFDSFGRRFGCSNRHPVQHIVLDPSWLNRNPYLPFNETVNNVSKVEGEAVVFPISDAATSADFIPRLMGKSHKGTFTAASGVFVYNGMGLTPDHQGNVFICESAQNLVQRQKMKPDGVSFSSHLVYEDKEFLASKNEWFRPVFLGGGPEDGLHIVDMHRKVIDHPAYVPERVRGKLDFQAGKDKGRIYKVLQEDQSPSMGEKKWLNASTPAAELAGFLQSEKQWDRETAHRLLLERKDSTVIPDLRKLVKNSPLPESRVRALWLLHSLDGLSAEILRIALGDKQAGVREQAVLLSEEKAEEDLLLKRAVIEASRDPDMRVRFNGALVLGNLQGPKVRDALASLAVRDGDDRWMRAAILSGTGESMGGFLKAFLREKSVNRAAYTLVMEDLGRMLGNGGSKAVGRELLENTLAAGENMDSKWRMAAVLGLMEGLTNRSDIEQSSQNILKYLYGNSPPEAVTSSWENFLDAITTTAVSGKAKVGRRVKAIKLMGFVAGTESHSVFKKLLQPENPQDVQLAVVRATGRQQSKEGAQLLVGEENWAVYTPTVRAAVLSEMLSQPVFIKVLINSIENQVVAPSDISSGDRRRLMNHQHETIRQRAKTLFAELEEGDRRQVYEEYLTKIKNHKGDPELGEKVFRRMCAVCHSYGGEGGNVGPDLTGIKNQPVDAILLHTLIPDYEVYPAYETVVVKTRSSVSVTGWVVSETANSMTIRTASGRDETVLRENIVSFTNTGKSLMPNGLEKTMTEEEMAGLIAYLKSGSAF